MLWSFCASFFYNLAMAVQPCIEWMSIKKTHLQHLIRMATFVFVLICSEALLNCHLTMSLNKETKYSYVEKCFFDQLPRNWVQWCCPGLSYFCLLPVGDIIDFQKNRVLSHIDTYFIEELWSYISYFILS